VTSDDALFALPGRPEVEVHVNPAGLAFRVMTVRVATVVVSGPAFRRSPGILATPGASRRAPAVRATSDGGTTASSTSPAPGFYGLIVDRLTHE
jgi:hypothetical protein